jgi:flagellin
MAANVSFINNTNRSKTQLDKSVNHISSGARVNQAADDSAAMSIAGRLLNDNVGIKKGMENTNMGISLLQTAEGGLSEITNILVRMRELAVQASNETYTSTERTMIDAEYQQAMEEIDRITDTSKYNRIDLLTSTDSSFVIQTGYLNDSAHRIHIDLTTLNADTTSLGLNLAPNLLTQSSAQDSISIIDNAQNSVMSMRSYIGSFSNRLEAALSDASVLSGNLSSSQSRIMDTDFAEESARMTQSQIMHQSSVAALAQARNISQTNLQAIFSNL